MSKGTGRRTLEDIFAAARTTSGELADREFRLWVYYRSWQVVRGKSVGASRPDSEAARDLGWSASKVQKARRRLIEAGYIKSRHRHGEVSLLWAVIPQDESHERAKPTGPGIARTCETTRDESHDVSHDESHDESHVRANIVREYGSTKDSSLRSESLLCDESLSVEREFPTLAKLPRNGRKRRIYPPEFDGAFATLPARSRPHPKADAYRAWRVQVQKAEEAFQLQAAADAYADECRSKDIAGTDFVMMAATFFGAGERWKPYSGVPTDHVWPKRKGGYRDQATDIDWAAEADKAEALAS